MPRVKPARDRKIQHWISARKAIQLAALLGFFALLVFARRASMPMGLLNLPLRLDPLVMLAHLLASKVFLSSTALALATVLLSLVFGRAWCGWLCPLGTLLDYIPLKKEHQKERPESWRAIKYSLLLILLAAALFGNLTLLVLDPLTILIRSFSASLWPLIDQGITVIEVNLYRLPGLSGAVAAFDEAIRPALLPVEPEIYRYPTLYLAVLIGIISLNLLAPRFWCRYLCPLGAMLALLAKFSVFQHRVADDCKGCALCEQACPTGTIDPQRGFSSDPGECIMCLDCLPACPRNSIAISPAISPAGQPLRWQAYDPSRRQALLSLGAAIAGAALLRGEGLSSDDQPYQLQPPGAQAGEFLSRCIRCAACIRACPTSALQPSLAEAGLGGLWTPVLVPRLGYCAYSCNDCGQVCPVEAIPPLSLEVKRQQVIGVASIDRDRCIAWAEGQECIVCEEMCPVPEKAIFLESSLVTTPDGGMSAIQVPHMQADLCIGCGICEYKCPVSGHAAIRVFTANI